jgi:type IV secretion system protein VirD4
MGRIRDLFRWQVPAKEACERFWSRTKNGLVRLPQGIHTAVFAPTGAGKSASLVIPFLLTCEDSCVVMDFKGELAKATADARERMGHEIVILDPWKMVTE